MLGSSEAVLYINRDILQIRQNYAKFHIVGLSKHFWSWNNVPMFQHFQIALGGSKDKYNKTKSPKSATKKLAGLEPPHPPGHFALIKNSFQRSKQCKILEKCSKCFGRAMTPPDFGKFSKVQSSFKKCSKTCGQGPNPFQALPIFRLLFLRNIFPQGRCCKQKAAFYWTLSKKWGGGVNSNKKCCDTFVLALFSYKAGF